MKTRSSLLVLLGFWLLALAVAGLGGWATASSVTSWYPTLAKPSWTPPSWLFGPVWTALYTLMAVAAWLIWRQPTSQLRRSALTAYFGQLGLNLAWSIVFFGLRRPDLGALEITLLWLAIFGTIVLFWRLSRLASALLWPYLAWVTFAAGLNFSIWQLNR